MNPYRTPGRVGTRPSPDWKPCVKCGGWLSPWHNTRRAFGDVFCVQCYVELTTPVKP